MKSLFYDFVLSLWRQGKLSQPDGLQKMVDNGRITADEKKQIEKVERSE